MKVYDYQCSKCGTRTEKFVKDSTVGTIECPVCHGTADRQVCTPHFKLDGHDPAGFPTAYDRWTKDQLKRAGDPHALSDEATHQDGKVL